MQSVQHAPLSAPAQRCAESAHNALHSASRRSTGHTTQAPPSATGGRASAPASSSRASSPHALSASSATTAQRKMPPRRCAVLVGCGAVRACAGAVGGKTRDASRDGVLRRSSVTPCPVRDSDVVRPGFGHELTVRSILRRDPVLRTVLNAAALVRLVGPTGRVKPLRLACARARCVEIVTCGPRERYLIPCSGAARADARRFSRCRGFPSSCTQPRGPGGR